MKTKSEVGMKMNKTINVTVGIYDDATYKMVSHKDGRITGLKRRV